jgi:hypothetical protein
VKENLVSAFQFHHHKTPGKRARFDVDAPSRGERHHQAAAARCERVFSKRGGCMLFVRIALKPNAVRLVTCGKKRPAQKPCTLASQWEVAQPSMRNNLKVSAQPIRLTSKEVIGFGDRETKNLLYGGIERLFVVRHHL